MNFRVKRVLLNICSSVITALTVLLAFFGLICVVFNVCYIQTEVVGYSMLPTLNSGVGSIYNQGEITYNKPEQPGDVIYINRFKEVNLNDIVVANVSWNEKPIIKRLIGLPGDKLEIKEEQGKYNLYVNDELLLSKEKTLVSNDGTPYGTKHYYEQYLNYVKNRNEEHEDEINFVPLDYILLGADEYFLMGDNWGGTTDSLICGPVNRDAIVGMVELIVPYKESVPSVFVKFLFEKIFC